MQVLRIMDVASLCGVHIQTIYRWRKGDPSFPEPFKVGSSVVWDEEDINKWLKLKKEMGHGSEREEGNQRADVRPADGSAEQP